MTVIVYSKPSCSQCRATVNRLMSLGIKYEYKDIAADINAAEQATKLAEQHGIRSMPIVVVGDIVWGGFNPDKLDRMATANR